MDEENSIHCDMFLNWFDKKVNFVEKSREMASWSSYSDYCKLSFHKDFHIILPWKQVNMFLLCERHIRVFYKKKFTFHTLNAHFDMISVVYKPVVSTLNHCSFLKCG